MHNVSRFQHRAHTLKVESAVRQDRTFVCVRHTESGVLAIKLKMKHMRVLIVLMYTFVLSKNKLRRKHVLLQLSCPRRQLPFIKIKCFEDDRRPGHQLKAHQQHADLSKVVSAKIAEGLAFQANRACAQICLKSPHNTNHWVFSLHVSCNDTLFLQGPYLKAPNLVQWVIRHGLLSVEVWVQPAAD
eukprot:1156919-Pelagomonas_calceolata.AAC.4